MRRTNLFDIPTCVSHNYARVSSGLVKNYGHDCFFNFLPIGYYGYSHNSPYNYIPFVLKVMEKSIFIHNIKVPYIGDYTVINKWKDYKS